MLKAYNLKKTYKPKKGQEVHALDDVSIEFEEKGLVFILGKSGSGKSTLLNVLGGLDTYDEGVIEVKGKSSKDFSQADFDSYRNTFIGFIFQDYNVLDGYSVEKNIGLALELQGKKADKERIEELIKQVDLEGLGKRKPNTLSGGQKQRVAIARALVKNPEIIMADEPTGALDSNTGKQVFDTLKKLSKEKLVIVVSHDREFAEIYGDRVVELADGKIISDIYKYKSEPKKSDGFEIVDDKILTIKKGTKLDAEKLDKLNEFLSSKDEDIIISTDLDANKKFKAFAKIDDEGNKESFKDTTKEDLDIKDYDPKDFKLIRSKLPFKDSFKMGASGLKSKKFRLFMTILLSSIAFALFGLADTMASYEKVGNTIKSIRDNHINVATFQKTYRLKNSNYDQITKMDDEDIKALKDKFGKDVYPVYYIDNNNYDWSSFSIGDNFYKSYSSSEYTTYANGINGFVEMDSGSVQQFGNVVAGSYPDSDNKIMLTSYVADSFVKFGLKIEGESYQSSDPSNISNRTELVGKTINLGGQKFTISGILDTNFDTSEYSKVLDKKDSSSNISNLLIKNQFEDDRKYGVHTLIFLNNGYYSRNMSKGDVADWIYGYVNFRDDTHNINFSADRLMKYKQNMENVYFFDNTKTSLASNEIILSFDKYNVNTSSFNTSILKYGEYESVDGISNKGLDFNEVFANISVEDKNNYPLLFEYYQNNGSMDGIFDAYARVYSWGEYNLEKEPWSNEGSYPNISGNQALKTEFESFIENFYDNRPCKFTLYRKFLSEYTESRIKQEYNDYLLSTGKTSSDYSIYSFLYNYESPLTKVKYESFMKYIAFTVSMEPYEIVTDYYNNGKKIEDTYTVVGFYIASSSEDWVRYCINDKLYEDLAKQSDPDRNKPYSYAIFKMDTDSLVKQAVKLSYTNKQGTNSVGNYTSYRLRNAVMSNFEFVNNLVEILAQVFLYIGIGFAVFAAFLLMNFISISISYKKREIGILRAIGARGFDVFKIFFNEAFIISFINFVISFAIAFAICIILNMVIRSNTGFKMTLLNIGIRQIGLMLGISVLVAIIASALPVSRIARKKPIDAIRNSTN